MTDSGGDITHVSIGHGDAPTISLTPYKRLRGLVVTAARRHLGKPARKYFPLETFRGYHRLRNRIAPQRYVDGDPFEVRYIDPNDIDFSVVDRSPKNPQWGRVEGGDWDRQREPFDARLVSQGIYERFDEGLPWEQTAYVDAFRQELRQFGTAWGYRSMANFDKRCAELERLFDRITSEGYRSQMELGYTPLDEINVDIARDGTPLWRCYGQHRLAIARLLDLDPVPVLIPRRHRHAVES